jgi:hypothetical protein
MGKEMNFGAIIVARAKAEAKKARAVRMTIRRIRKLCAVALTSKTDADLQSTVAALSVAVAAFVNALTR